MIVDIRQIQARSDECLYPGIRQPFRYFSLARYAFGEALRMAGASDGAYVLLPEYLCRDLLAPLAKAGAQPVWYPVDENLAPAIPSDEWPDARAVLAVNYFGFPQNLDSFRTYCARTEATLIEDNAHGFLSCDAAGAWLGQRGDLGLYSMRKTLPIPDGAALSVNCEMDLPRLAPQLPFTGAGIATAQRLKGSLRRIPGVGPALARIATQGARGLRALRSGSATPAPNPDSEVRLPAAPEPWRKLPSALRLVDISAESQRRRTLYAEFAVLASGYDVQPVFATMPDGCVPYGFPFRAGVTGLDLIGREASRRGLDMVTWPDLPAAVAAKAPEHYRDIWLVNFLW